MKNFQQSGIAIAGGVCCIFLAIAVGAYFGVGAGRIWFYKVLHICAGFLLAMFFSSRELSSKGVCIGTFVVSTLWELYEFFLILPQAAMFHRLFPWYGLPIVSVSDLFLDYIWNFSGVAVFYLASSSRGWLSLRSG